jgi:outer membrane protein OmpA-like peptidoglycan-associated protein
MLQLFLKATKPLLTILFLFGIVGSTNAQLFKKLKEKANQALDKTIDKTVDKAIDPKETTPAKNENTADNSNTNPEQKPTTTANSQPLNTYKNYDFVPGDKIIFEDHFDTDEEGEFAQHWNLLHGQGAVNTFMDRKVLLLTSADSKVSPAIKSPAYLTDSFTIEFDNYSKDDFGPQIWFYKSQEDAKDDYTELVKIVLNERNGYYTLNVRTKDHKGETAVQYPASIEYDLYRNKWHHIAIAYKNRRLKIYVDEYRVMAIPDIALNASSLALIGDGRPNSPVMITNFKLAQGAGIKTQEKKFTDTKIVTHGINFDINMATIKPESMGTINAIADILKNNPELKFEIQGHTDNSGIAATNLSLSQKRADAVKQQMVDLGIDESRLTSKGFGDTKPIADNASLEGKANNRRVEFKKL